MFVFFFFFQAEDGIRDADVTGVQTCALPIYGERAGHADREAGGDDGDRAVERREEAADGAEDLDEAVVEPEEEVADHLGVDAPLAAVGGDHHVLVLELVLEHLAHGGAQRGVAVALPDVEVLLDAVDLDRLEHHVDGRRAEEAAHGDDERELETASRVERRDVLETEERLPEGDMARLDRDERVEDRPHARRRDLAQRAVEGEIEDLVEDETAAEPHVDAPGRGGHVYGSSRRRRSTASTNVAAFAITRAAASSGKFSTKP